MSIKRVTIIEPLPKTWSIMPLVLVMGFNVILSYLKCAMILPLLSPGDGFIYATLTLPLALVIAQELETHVIT